MTLETQVLDQDSLKKCGEFKPVIRIPSILPLHSWISSDKAYIDKK
jgi:hypothetical protein